MTSWAIGLSTGCFYHQSILDCLLLIRESGFSMIEVCSSPEHLNFRDLKSVQRAADRIKELGMEAYSFHAPFAPNIDIASSNPAQRAASVAEIYKAAEAAAVLRVHYFVLHPGPENPAADTSRRTVAAHATRRRFPESGRSALQRTRHHVRAREQIAASPLWEYERHLVDTGWHKCRRSWSVSGYRARFSCRRHAQPRS